LAEKDGNSAAIKSVICSSSGRDNFRYLSSADAFNSITSDSQSQTELAGALGLVSFRLIPNDVSPASIFTYTIFKQEAAIIRDISSPYGYYGYYGWNGYSMPIQANNPVGGPYNFDVTNTLDSTCVSSTDSKAYVRTSWSDSSVSSCSAYVGTGTIARTFSGGKMRAITVTGTMPPSEVKNTRQIGYDKIAMTLSSSDIDAVTTNNTLSGSIEGFEMAKNASSVEVDTSKVFKLSLDDGSYIKTKETLNSNGAVLTTNALEATLKLSFTAINTKGVGILTANDRAVDKNGRADVPKTIVFDGTLSDISSGGAGDILKGKLTMTRPKYGQIDSTKQIDFGNDDGLTVSFLGSVNAKQSRDYIRASLTFSRTYRPSPKPPEDSVAIRLEIAGGFDLTGIAISDDSGKGGTIKLKNQDGIRLWATPGKDPILYAGDEKTELGQFKNAANIFGGSGFYFIDGTVVTLN